MFEIVLSNRFKKDLKLAAKRGLALEELNAVVEQLSAGQSLPDKNRDHALTGDYIGFREWPYPAGLAAHLPRGW